MAAVALSKKLHREIHKLVAAGLSHSAIARKLQIDRGTVAHYARVIVPAEPTPTKAGSDLPVPHPPRRLDYPLTTAGNWLIISDLHIPFHDLPTIRAAFAEAKRRGCVGAIFNGDVMDCHNLSRFDKDPTKPKIQAEIEAGRQFVAWARKQLPKAKIVWKEGNHEERLTAYLSANAAALVGLDVLEWASLMHLDTHGIEYVTHRMRIDLGKLPVVHGHEFFRGFAPPVNPARGLFLKAKSPAICGHHHQTSEHRERDIKGKEIATWTLGCACELSPDYGRFSNWNHGFAFVDLASDGTYVVDNLTMRGGQIK